MIGVIVSTALLYCAILYLEQNRRHEMKHYVLIFLLVVAPLLAGVPSCNGKTEPIDTTECVKHTDGGGDYYVCP